MIRTWSLMTCPVDALHAWNPSTVALSSMEVEYMAVAYAAHHGIWMHAIMAELTFAQEKATKHGQPVGNCALKGQCLACTLKAQ